jgi:hypothetical protein
VCRNTSTYTLAFATCPPLTQGVRGTMSPHSFDETKSRQVPSVGSSVRPAVCTTVSCIVIARAIRLTSSRAPLHQRGRSTQQTCGHYVGDNYLGSVHYVVQQIPFQMVSPLSRVSRHFVMPCRQRLAKFCIVQLPATKISRNICPSGIWRDGRLFHLRRVHACPCRCRNCRQPSSSSSLGVFPVPVGVR